MAASLELPGKVSRVGLTLPKSLTHDDWLTIGGTLREMESGVMWWLGDWLRFGEQRKWGEQYSEAVKLGFDYDTARAASWVADKIEFVRRRTNLTWGHHREVAAEWITPAAADRLLDKAERGDGKERLSVMELRAAVRALRAQKRIGEIIAQPLPTGDPVQVLYVDPPWQYENPPMGGGNRAIENHYPTLELDEICALKIGECATADAVLFLWATAPKSAECLQVLAHWNFTYRTHLVWDKELIGMGYHARNRHELLLIAKRGEIPPPEPADRPESIIAARRSDRHSEKPEVFYEIIDRMYPRFRKREFFARHRRQGWEEPWGNQQIIDATAV